MPSPPSRTHTPMGPGAEFDTIRQLMESWGNLAVDIGDDAAILSFAAEAVGDGRQLVISTDACVEGVHFREGWLAPSEVGGRAVAAALSDLAACGARADAVLLSFIVPDAWRSRLREVAEGIGQVLRPTGARIVGGNLSRGADFSISTTVVGSATRPISRRGARVGDRLLLTGTLGGPGQALALFEAGRTPLPWARERFANPVPRLREGEFLSRVGVRAMLDVSDGIVADARHLAAASAVRLRLDAAMLPMGPGVSRNDALVSGEEYELLLTAAPAVAEWLVAEWSGFFTVPITIVGEVTGEAEHGAVDIEGATEFGSRVEFASGHDHFSS